MSETMKDGFKIKELEALLKACHEARVTELAFGNLKVSFAPHVSEPKVSQNITDQMFNMQANSPSEESEGINHDERKIREDQMEQMLLENPALYEELLAAGELEDGQANQH